MSPAQLDPKAPETTKVAAILDKVATPDWRIAHRMWSVQLSVLWAILCGLWAALPALQSWFSPEHFALICVGFALLILVGRLVNQPSLPMI